MSNTKHTPGPWRVDERLSCAAIATSKGDLTYIYRHTGIAEAITVDELKANASLIAAAPTLLEACKAMLAVYENAPVEITAWWESQISMLRAAIAKAEGSK